VLLLVSHLGDQIERHFGDGRTWGLEVRYSYEPTPLGTAGALRLALPHLDESFLLLNGDTYLDADLTALVSRYRACGCAAMMAVYGNPPPQIAPNNVAVTLDGRISRYRKGEPAGMTHVDAGVYMLARATIEPFETGRSASLERDVFLRLAELGALAAFETPVRYYDIGTFERLEAAEKGLP
jgi:NDP-sugar pyrophosphorylase family protein